MTLNEMRFATAGDVLTRVRFLTRTGSHRRFLPILTDFDMDSYLRFLAKRGVVYFYMYKRFEGAPVERIYFVTQEGFLLFSTQLMLKNSDKHYDKAMSYKPPFDIFKILTVNRVMSAFMKSKKCINAQYYPAITIEMERPGFQNRFFGLVTLEDEKCKHSFIFEPIKFRVPEDKISFQENYERVRQRLYVLKKMVNTFSADFGPSEVAFVVLLVEDLDGLRHLFEILKEDNERSFWEQTAYVTSDYAICDSFLGDAYNAMFGISYVGANIAVEQKRPYIDMELPVTWRQLSDDK